MLLAMDIGNTNLKIGVFDGGELKSSWRMSTTLNRTADEFASVLLHLMKQDGIEKSAITSVIISSVAPRLNYTVEHMCTYYFGVKPLFVTAGVDVGITVEYDTPELLGSDRIVGAAAAYHFYGGPVIEVDFGTATTFNLVSKDGRFLGGAISPGITTATQSLVNNTSKLPSIELVKPESILGTDTCSCMQSGIIYGFLGLVQYMVQSFKALDGMANAKVIATGGLSEIVSSCEPKLFDVVDRTLALNGLNYIHERCKKGTI